MPRGDGVRVVAAPDFVWEVLLATTIRQPDGRILARLRPTEEEPGQPTKVYTVGRVLAAWRGGGTAA